MFFQRGWVLGEHIRSEVPKPKTVVNNMSVSSCRLLICCGCEASESPTEQFPFKCAFYNLILPIKNQPLF